MLGARVLGRVGEREEGAGHFQGGLQSKYKEVFFSVVLDVTCTDKESVIGVILTEVLPLP